MRERYVLLGVAPARADWFRTVGQWAAAAVLPAEFVRCVSLAEVRARLRSSRAFSAVLVDGRLPGLDRDLVATATDVGCAVVVVEQPPATRDWPTIGVAATLPAQFSRDELLEVLHATARPVRDATGPQLDVPTSRTPAARGGIVAVTGPGGTGASTTAIALAQGLAAGHGAPANGISPRSNGRRRNAAGGPRVLLADLCRRADQAMLHDARVVVPGLPELVEAHRNATPSPEEVLEQTFAVDERGYRLLLGLRRSHHWVGLRQRALEATLDSLQRSVDLVVADVEDDLEGEAETGSLDVEERHLLARATIARAGAVVAVGEPSTKGAFTLVRTITGLLSFGVPAARILPAFVGSPRRARARAELTASVASLAAANATVPVAQLPSAIHLPARAVDHALRDGVALPAPLPATITRAVTAVLDRAGALVEAPPPSDAPAAGPVRLAPGSLAGLLDDDGHDDDHDDDRTVGRDGEDDQ